MEVRSFHQINCCGVAFFSYNLETLNVENSNCSAFFVFNQKRLFENYTLEVVIANIRIASLEHIFVRTIHLSVASEAWKSILRANAHTIVITDIIAF